MFALLKFPTLAQTKIEEATEKGELTELVLMVIWNRLDLARRDVKKDIIRSLDLLYRRVEGEILKREATPAMRLLNDLLNMPMVDTFPRVDPFSILVPEGFDIDKVSFSGIFSISFLKKVWGYDLVG
ncbi:unnamed protein product [Prunus brigantina]